MAEKIRSTSNKTIKLIRKLANRKERKNTGLFYIEGILHVVEAVQVQAGLEMILHCPELLASGIGDQALSGAEKLGIPVIEVPEHVFRSFALKDNPQGIAAVAKQNWIDLDDVTRIKGIWTALVDIQDPGNLGSVLRSSEGVGGKGVILVDETTDPYHPTAVRASMGALFTQHICSTQTSDLAEWKSKTRYHIVGAFTENAVNYRQYNYPEDMILMMGSEQKGLNKSQEQICDGSIVIPMKGSIDSLNLANAASIILFEIKANLEEKI